MKIVERAGATALAIPKPEVLLPDPTPRHEPTSCPTNKLMESCQRTRRHATLNHTRAQVSFYQVSKGVTRWLWSAWGESDSLWRTWRFAMPIPLRTDFDADALRRIARRSKDGAQARRLLALAAIYEGATRTEAARIGGVTRQIVR